MLGISSDLSWMFRNVWIYPYAFVELAGNQGWNMKEPAGSHSRILRGQAHSNVVDSSQKPSLEFLEDSSELVQLLFCGDCLCSSRVL